MKPDMLSSPTDVHIRGANDKYVISDAIKTIEDSLANVEYDYEYPYVTVRLARILSIQETLDIRSLYLRRSWRDVQPYLQAHGEVLDYVFSHWNIAESSAFQHAEPISI